MLFVSVKAGTNTVQSVYLMACDDITAVSHRTTQSCDCGKIISSEKRTLPEVCTTKTVVHICRRKWSSDHLFQFLVETCFVRIFAKIFYVPTYFSSKFYLQNATHLNSKK